MNYKEYASAIQQFDIYPEHSRPTCYFYGLAGEVGELNIAVHEKVFSDIDDTQKTTIDHVKSEAGDWLWYATQISRSMGFDLETYLNKKIEPHEIGISPFKHLPLLTGFSCKITETLKKVIRDDYGKFTDKRIQFIEEHMEKAAKHFMYLLAYYKIDLTDVIKYNISKLSNRKKTNTLHGYDGDGKRVEA